jgi:hypothetical protein
VDQVTDGLDLGLQGNILLGRRVNEGLLFLLEIYLFLQQIGGIFFGLCITSQSMVYSGLQLRGSVQTFFFIPIRFCTSLIWEPT